MEESVPDSDEPIRDEERDELEESEVERLCASPTSPVGDASMELETIAKENAVRDARKTIAPMYVTTASNKSRVPF